MTSQPQPIRPHTHTSSPFEPVLAAHVSALPAVLRDHYLLAADAPHRIVLEGTMERVWHRPRWLWPLFWLLTFCDLLFPETGTAIPATMTVTGHWGVTGEGYHTWDRTFAFPRLRRFNAVMAYDPQQGCVVERLGPGQVLQMAWNIQFQPPATVAIVTTGCALRLGGWTLPLPRLLYPSVRAVESALLDRPSAIRVDLTMTDPWLGPIFGYAGTFVLRREPLGDAP